MEVSQAQWKFWAAQSCPNTTAGIVLKTAGIVACWFVLQTGSVLADDGANSLPSVSEALALDINPFPRETSPRTTLTPGLAASDRSTFASFRPTELASLPIQRPIGLVNIDIRPKSKAGIQTLPTDQASQALGDIPIVNASPATELNAVPLMIRARGAEAFPYGPLYFEQANLERYGRYHSPLQPATSALRFFTTIPLLPYAMTIRDPHTAYYWDWPYEAGWAAPRVRELPPFERRAAVVESAIITGLVFLLP